MGVQYKREEKTAQLTRSVIDKVACDNCGKEQVSEDGKLTEWPIGWLHIRKKFAGYYDGYYSGIYCCDMCAIEAITNRKIPGANVFILDNEWHEK